MLLIVSEWYSDSNGVSPVINSKSDMPTAQLSTFSVQLPPKNISGALQQQVPVLVNISSYRPLNFIFLLSPKSINLTIPRSLSYSMFFGLMSLWQMLFSWMQASASSILQKTNLRLFQSSPALREGKGECSMMSLQTRFLRLRQSALYLMMLSCLSCLMQIKLVLIDRQCSSSILSTFTANYRLLSMWMHFFTTPCAPSPIFSSSQNCYSKAFQESSHSYCLFLMLLKIYRPADSGMESARLARECSVLAQGQQLARSFAVLYSLSGYSSSASL